MSEPRLFVGLMSGTSADSIDAALVAFHDHACKLVATYSHPLSPAIRSEIHALALAGSNEISRMGVLDAQLGRSFAEAVQQLLAKASMPVTRITAIGSHGQTIRHEPSAEGGAGFTLQIGDPNIIAEQTGILTIADFRRRDIACGGQGAPLAPAFHQAVFSSAGAARCVVNIGGIANITTLPIEGAVIGFDTGPGNMLLDAWIQRCRGETFDRDGAWAASGLCNRQLLETLLRHPFLHRSPPKSTGREEFNLEWLQRQLATVTTDFAPEDVQATLLEFTAITLARAIESHCAPETAVFVCGGGAHNGALISRLKNALPDNTVDTTAVLGIEPDWVEAAAFAWLAKQHVDGKPGNLPSVTGASRAVVLGSATPS